jgi:hypothetical protein
MCTTKILRPSNAGFINQLTECFYIPLTFDVSHLRLTLDEFSEIGLQIYNDVQHVNNQINPDSKGIPDSEFSFVLNTNKLIQLNDSQEAIILLTAHN